MWEIIYKCDMRKQRKQAKKTMSPGDAIPVLKWAKTKQAVIKVVWK